MGRKKVSTTVYLTTEQDETLKRLSGITKVPVAEYVRQGIDLILKANEHNLPTQINMFAANDED